MQKIALFWFRRDLRLQDNAGLYHALKSGLPVLPLFIFDRNILDDLDDREDARVAFLHERVGHLKSALEEGYGSSMLVRYGYPEEVWKALLDEYEVGQVYTNRDYEPYAKKRDGSVAQLVEDAGAGFHHFKDHVIFEAEEVQKKAGGTYTVFTPYSRTWKSKLKERMSSFQTEDGDQEAVSYYLKPYPTLKYAKAFATAAPLPMPSLSDMGFAPSAIEIPSATVSRKLIKHYDQTRDIPSINGTSRLGIHFRFGTISIRQKAWRASKLNETFLNELIWRDFYAQILDENPHVANRSFREAYDHIEWRNDETEFKKWCEGKTGYPIVDAGMRELNQTGYMHNRVRMITASFLTKHLLIDWRWGEAYFAKKLLDYDLASNNGGWQWAAGSGTDAAPYFRVFNPTAQQQKFDKEYKYIKQWVPEFGTSRYPKPIVDHKIARERCLETYKAALG
ncbi:cryptochrome/photolyase family protein [Phaeodactylibacter luteus]|uniref:Deoxyribodipyrimidine photo-lyase n=1 Tax=Phaeodactylibacter luteus TaxID=1564516 RepID=A0A5C6RIX2_9BACT|nr:deoxyribodipyrimidine photo-lyase [Phaeodactylibacter luteus]TXB62366.1 deoxyribodipyrimidine photo-lyase [Phaeodactylibacter luteus]